VKKDNHNLAVMTILILLTILFWINVTTSLVQTTRVLKYRTFLKSKNAIDWNDNTEKESDRRDEEEIQRIESLFQKSQNHQKLSLEKNNDEQIPLDETRGDILLPTTGVSISDAIDEAQRDVFHTELVPVTTLPGVAQIVTKSRKGSFDPIRYIVTLSSSSNSVNTNNCFVMTDIPPYSDRLAAQIRSFMGSNGKLLAIFLTSRTGVHYDEGAGVYTTRTSSLKDWMAVFPNLYVVGYRLDVPRDISPIVQQKLNGYGPWAWNEQLSTFEETGNPRIFKEWDSHTIKTYLQRGLVPPIPAESEEAQGDSECSPESLRQKEQGKKVLAVYTPGHTHGSVCYVFPEINVVVSGFTVPIEDPGSENKGQIIAPSMDARGYITTSNAGIDKQMESARKLVNDYSDRFGIILPARDDPFFLDQMEHSERNKTLMRIIDQYDEIGKAYSRLENTSEDDDDDDYS
jgi:hypothetical protein